MDRKRLSTIDLNICQWNCRSIRPKLIAFENVLLQEKIHIAVLCETWLEPDSHLKLSNYNIYRSDRHDGYGGVAIITHKSLKSHTVHVQNPNPHIQVLHLKVYNCADIQNIIAVYCPPSAVTTHSDWDRVLSISTRKSLILGDMNSHHINWSHKTDNIGKQVFDSLVDYNLVTLNDGSPTLVKLINGHLHQSAPDLSITSPDIALKCSWKTLNESLGSDHLMIKISVCAYFNSNVTRKRNYKKADWKAYESCLEDIYSKIELPNELQKAYDTFVDFINIAADLHIPFVKINLNPPGIFSPKPYWSTDLSKTVAERRLALAKFRRNPTPQNLEILQAKINEAQKAIRQASSKNWQTFCSSLEEITSPSEMWRRMRWLKGYRSQHNYNYVDTNKATELIRSLTPDFVSPSQPLFSSCNSQLDLEFTMSELTVCIRSKDTAPGCDDITYSMINYLPENAKFLLLHLYNKFYTLSFIPVQWRDINIIPIPKPGRNSQYVSALRPISMMSCLCKIFHSMLNNRLERYLESNNYFSDSSTEFRKYRSTLDNLTNLTTRIQIGFSKKNSTIATFLDLDNAYNNVEITCLLHIIDGLGVGAKVCRYLWNFLRLRQLKIKVNDQFIARNTGRGLAQGDPLSPLLFNMATIHICKDINNVYVSQYADDFVLYYTSQNIQEGISALQLALKKILN